MYYSAVDPSFTQQTVTIEEVAAALSHFKRTESLHRGNSTWKALTEWLKSVVTEDGPWSKDMLNKYLQSTVFNMLKQNQEGITYIVTHDILQVFYKRFYLL